MSLPILNHIDQAAIQQELDHRRRLQAQAAAGRGVIPSKARAELQRRVHADLEPLRGRA